MICCIDYCLLVFGLYINELLVKLIQEHEDNPNLYKCYHDTLHSISHLSCAKIALRKFEFFLLQELGYGIDFLTAYNNEKIAPNNYYTYAFETGFFSNIDNKNGFSGQILLDLANLQFNTHQHLQDAHKITNIVLTNLLNGKKINTRKLYLKGKKT